MPGNINAGFLSEVRDITFIAQHKVDRYLTDLCPQYNSEAFIAFAGSASYHREQLIWTTANLLPQWADPTLWGQNKTILAQHLHVIVDPPVEMVAENLINVVNNVNREQVTLVRTEKTVAVFQCMYRYLHEQDELPSDVIKKLSEEPTVLIVRERKYVAASKTVEVLSDDAEIRPYLYRIPPEFGIFAPLLKRLGATEKPTADQYMAVLTDIKRDVGEKNLPSESLLAVKKAFLGLFTKLEGIDRESFVTEVLYLPNEDNRLVNACHLTFNDAPAYYLRMAELMFVCDVKEFGFEVLSVKRCLKRLPERLQPRFLSECITEELVSVDDAPPENNDDVVAEFLNERIRSEEFGRMALRLLHHEATCSQERIDKESLSSLAERLSVVRVVGVDEVRTQLRYKQVIPGSVKEKVCFLSKVHGQLAGTCQWRIYVKKGCPLQIELLVPLADVIDTILDGRLRKSALYLLPLLNPSDTSMSRTLDECNVTEYCSQRA